LAQKGWHIDVLAEPIDSPRPELFPGQKIFVWTGKSPTLASRNSSITGVNRGLLFHFIIDRKRP
jgi:hypothetical protein